MNTKLEDKLHKIIHELYKDFTETGGGKGYRYFHSMLTADYAKKIVMTEQLEVDEDSLIIACLFHDIRKLEAIDENGILDYDHTCCIEDDNITFEHIAKHIRRIVSKETIRKAVEIIRNKDTKNASLESKILHDADDLCNAGVLSTWRTIAYAIIMDRGVHDTVTFWDDVMLKQEIDLADSLFFKSSQRTARKRTKAFLQWLANMQTELSGEDIC